MKSHLRLPWLAVVAAVGLLAGSVLVDFAPTAYAQDSSKSGGAQAKAPGKGGKAPAKAMEAPPAPKVDYEAALKNLRFREIGPATMGGRIDDFAVVESDPRIVYVGAASGGLFKTTNGGTTWESLWADQPVSTIGDVTVAQSDPSIVWVGTGEPNNRQSSSWGNGVYKSTDAGATWQHMGLTETHHIGRIVINPKNPDIVYVAAIGRLWGPSKERGVYRTTDGGKSWTNVLFINEDTGVVDIAMDPESPGTLYAGAYQRRRTVWGFNGSGPHGGIYKTTDGGATWKKLIKGLPWDPDFRPTPQPGGGGGGFGGGGGGGGAAALAALQAQQQQQEPEQRASGPQEIGRIGVNVYRRDPNVVYALVEHRNGGTFRSDDKGETWTRMSTTNPRAMYYSKIHIDPNNDQRLWVHGAQMFYSDDGGRTFRTNLVQRIHGDYHAMWINPANSDHIWLGSDGGIHKSLDRGRTWDFINNIPLAQFYEIGADMRKPYYICGGLQDNNTWCGPSATMDNAGIPNSEWFTIGGGDGFYAQMDPLEPHIVYAESQDGNVLRRDLRTHESRSIRPQPAEGEARYRFQWNSPIVISAHDNKTIYYGGNFLFKSPDRGDSWTKVSPDLTNNEDRNAKEIMGKVPDVNTLSRHDGVQQWPCITTIGESSVDKNVLWAGTDDGNLQVTRDGGKTWKNVADKVPGVPKGTYVSRVIASKHAAGTAYVTFDGHRMNDFNIYVFTTSDFGETWKAIRNGIPDNKGIANVIREHHRNPKLLFVGTEYGMYVSFDQGANWTRLKLNMPTVPVDDILIHPRDNDLIVGTHGRSIWILDDITPLEQLTEAALNSDLHVFETQPATAWRTANRTTSASTGHKTFRGPNPPNGVLVHYYLKSKVEAPEGGQGVQGRSGGQAGRVRVTIADSDGRTIRTINNAPGEAGINRVVWDMRMNSPIPPAGPGQGGGGFGGGGGGGGGGFGGGGGGSRVDPGTFTVKVLVAGKEMVAKATVEEDPRVELSAADRAARRAAITQLSTLVAQAVTAQRSLQTVRTNVNTAVQSWRRPGNRTPDNIKKAGEDYLKRIDEVFPRFANLPQQGVALGAAGPPLTVQEPTITARLTQLLGQMEGTSLAPTAWQLEQIKILSAKLAEFRPKVQPLVTTELAALNKLMNEAGLEHIAGLPARGGAAGGGGNSPPDDEPDPEDQP